MLLGRGGTPLGFSFLPGASDNISADISPGAEFGSSVLLWTGGSLLTSGPAVETLYFFSSTAAFQYYSAPLDLSILYKIVLPVVGSVLCCCGLIGWFLWYFRRKPDAVEPMVLKSNIEIGKQRSRKKKERRVHEAQNEAKKVYVEHYEL